MPAATFESVIVARFLMGLARRTVHQGVDAALDNLASRPLTDQSVVEAVHNAVDKIGVDIASVMLSQSPWDALLGDAVFEGPDNCVLIEFKASWDERQTEVGKPRRQSLVRSLNGDNSALQGCADRCHWFVFGPTESNELRGGMRKRTVDPLLTLTVCTPYRTIWTHDAAAIVELPPTRIPAEEFIRSFLAGGGAVGVAPDKFTEYLHAVMNGEIGNDGGFAMALMRVDGKLQMAMARPATLIRPARQTQPQTKQHTRKLEPPIVKPRR